MIYILTPEIEAKLRIAVIDECIEAVNKKRAEQYKNIFDGSKFMNGFDGAIKALEDMK